MKNRFTRFLAGLVLVFASGNAFAQTTAMDFNRMDCNGNMQHLFADLDAGNAVILEFFMQNCTPCINAGNHLEALKTDLLAAYPGRVKSYAIGFTNSYSCASNQAWVTTNGFTSIPMDSGATQVSYYGGFGMPTIVLLGGANHSILGSPYIGFSSSDTTQMGITLRDFLSGATSIHDGQALAGNVAVFPNPAQDMASLQFTAPEAGTMTAQVLDLTGRAILPAMEASVAAGEVVQPFSTATLAAGCYLLQVRLNGQASTTRFTVTH